MTILLIIAACLAVMVVTTILALHALNRAYEALYREERMLNAAAVERKHPSALPERTGSQQPLRRANLVSPAFAGRRLVRWSSLRQRGQQADTLHLPRSP
ncbi:MULTISPECIES: hypothetical protein [Alphaproteobacteria]|uniref:Uncharacterized protein n=2 Tax=Alphaproteobacteria TaxID=28211 RepID=A0A512HHD2_9HYPH|nr:MULTISPECIES: hypothetical protein [Alphaproteobacteria]GEO84864.1 hypothetical protein RNA01_17960 [Ciceribacter naphthalenivorans]GLR22798.1 hypothetical protein GCM10007920_25860 [Ciceribacter naphthalenivorans]GLT05654.1 hypothetical protein GCM10007926_25860 [Sphingomonas psychrolutea]